MPNSVVNSYPKELNRERMSSNICSAICLPLGPYSASGGREIRSIARPTLSSRSSIAASASVAEARRAGEGPEVFGAQPIILSIELEGHTVVLKAGK